MTHEQKTDSLAADYTHALIATQLGGGAGTAEAPAVVATDPDADTRRAELRARMQRGQEKMREMRAAGWKPVHLNPVEQAKANPNSMKAAIKAFCWLCEGADADPGTKVRVRDCAVGDKCPLHPHRPWQNVKGSHPTTDENGELVATDDSEDTSED